MKRTTAACRISREVAEEVKRRDGDRCVICGATPVQLAHYVSRARLGLGIPQNIVCLCYRCHYALDNGSSISEHRQIKNAVERHLRANYDNWNEKDLVYKKGETDGTIDKRTGDQSEMP